MRWYDCATNSVVPSQISLPASLTLEGAVSTFLAADDCSTGNKLKSTESNKAACDIIRSVVKDDKGRLRQAEVVGR